MSSRLPETIKAILVGIAFMIVGFAMMSSPSDPVWLFPIAGLTFVAGGVIVFVLVATNKI